ncbi:MAG: SDR family oxidoreductase [Clostridiales bacterium]|jgi:NAD(P)-dependent dehydrogenase (short-subunit alcohol dehydrogenase family)|nr:SDR family oxidoreductase [Clostridiales bacterium]
MRQEYVKKLFCLDGRKAIVTGGNSGIGKGIAAALASLGADVAFVGRHEPTIAQTEKELVALGSKAKGYKVDVGAKDEVDRFFDAYYAENGKKLDILVANASVQYDKRMLDATEFELEQMYHINLKGLLFFAQRAAEAMKEQMGGNIVVVTSLNALRPNPPQALYSGSKAAQEALMRCLASDLGEYNIRVNSLAPGAVMTNIGLNDRDRHAQERAAPGEPAGRNPAIPLGRLGTPEDMGAAVACIVSDAFSYMTGATVLVDGGLALR